MSSINFVDDFLHYTVYQKGGSENSATTYKRCILYFIKWYEETNGNKPDPADITSIDLRLYQEHLQKVRKLKANTINLYLKSLKLFMEWLYEIEKIGRVPSFPKPVKTQQLKPKALSRNEQNRILREVEKTGNVRDIAIVRLLMSCGLRISELVEITVASLDIGERYGYVSITGKGNKTRRVPIPVEARKAVKEWLKERDKKYPNNPYLFPGRFKEHLSVRQVGKIITNLGYFARIEGLHPHTLRHTCATNMVRAGVDLVTVAEILGHTSLDTTKIYTKPDERTMQQAVERAEA